MSLWHWVEVMASFFFGGCSGAIVAGVNRAAVFVYSFTLPSFHIVRLRSPMAPLSALEFLLRGTPSVKGIENSLQLIPSLISAKGQRSSPVGRGPPPGLRPDSWPARCRPATGSGPGMFPNRGLPASGPKPIAFCAAL